MVQDTNASNSNFVILIGGAPTTGKSEIAKRLSEQLHIPWISTDQIRAIMRSVADATKYPNLFTPAGYDAERFLQEFSAQEIADKEYAQGESTWIGVKEFVDDEYTWPDGFIVEGVNILPHLVARDYSGSDRVKAVFLVDEDADRMREVVFTRGLWDDADVYPDHVKEKEVEWATLFSHKLKIEVEQHKYPWVEVTKQDSDVQAVLSALELII